MIKGTYQDIDSRITVHLVTYISLTRVLLFYSMLLLITIIFNALVINSGNTPTIVFVIFNAFYIFFGLRIYLSFRKAVTTLTRNVEREMGFWMARVNALQQELP